MLVALYDELSVEIEGTEHDLKALIDSLTVCTSRCELTLFSPSRFDEWGRRYLGNLIVSVDPDRVQISVVEGSLIISGAKDKLRVLADNVVSLNRQVSETRRTLSKHTHIEYYPGHFFLAHDALPLVVARQETE